jgi:hypothetical protein
MTEAIDE